MVISSSFAHLDVVYNIPSQHPEQTLYPPRDTCFEVHTFPYFFLFPWVFSIMWQRARLEEIIWGEGWLASRAGIHGAAHALLIGKLSLHGTSSITALEVQHGEQLLGRFFLYIAFFASSFLFALWM